ncbi:DnaJ C-terminal domain-containing protein [Xylophilus sp.]|uniref:DnaJ C-terminal domain-containing protein n=1 Tax=Xylophilus sp. TaxID=2653893 RepID=UPI0013B89B6D|nr:DnaJ C-terminal domain-containing protein [Xylophilus sp.]KAF1047785.1 MAG: Curved DNA-binding protein [Xylophilus sp.]
MDFKDYYAILGVERQADADTVKKAYRRLARKYHPDVSKEADAATRMSEVNEAYAVLSDPEKRAAYDELGRQPQGRAQGGQGFQPPPDWASGFEFTGGAGGDEHEFSDFFSSLFGQAAAARAAREAGGHTRRSGPRRGSDHHARIDIDLADAYSGATRTLTLRGAELDETGHVVPRERTLEVRIPQGVKAGQLIRLTGYGAPGADGQPAGDLYLEVYFNEDARWRIDGRDVHQTLPVAPWEAALGAAVEVATPAGTLEVTVPPNSRPGRRLRLKGRGIPGEPPGDIYLTLDVAWPPADTPRARELYETMARDLAFNPRAAARS